MLKHTEIKNEFGTFRTGFFQGRIGKWYGKMEGIRMVFLTKEQFKKYTLPVKRPELENLPF